MERFGIVIVLLVCLWNTPVCGQTPTGQGPAPLHELITLSRSTPFDQALRVIRAFSNRMIVEPRGLAIPIGVDIDRKPWQWALVQIAKQNDMMVVEHRDYYEVLPIHPEEATEKATGIEGVTLDSREVNISAVFFQADRSAIRELGVDWSTLSSGRVAVRAAQRAAQEVSRNLFSVGIQAPVGNSMSVDALLRALEENNAGEVVANPQIKVQTEKNGYIQVGADFSITTSDFAGNAITQFFSTGTILRVTPTILTQEGIDFVNLEVEAERSSLVDPERNLISKTVARTSALLKDGEQTAVGGLYGHERSSSRAGVPLLKDLPGWFFGLRYLFGRNSKQVVNTELVVLLKVDIVPSVRERIKREAAKTSDIVRESREAFEGILEEIERGREKQK